VFVWLVTAGLWGAETWLRFVQDSTDSFGASKVCGLWFKRHWRVNDAGVRDDVEYAPDVPRGKRRITFVGDSFTAGHGIKEVRDRFPNLLRREHPEWDVQVLANIGLDTGDEAALVSRAVAKGEQLGDVVLVYCLNDVVDLMTAGREEDNTRAGRLAPYTWLVEHSYAVDFMDQRMRAFRTPSVRNYYGEIAEGYRGKVWEEQKRRLRDFRSLVEGHGGRLKVVTFPFLHALGADYGFEAAHGELDRFWEESGVPHLDLLGEFRGRTPASLTVNRFDAHPNELANRLAAEAIERFLAK
jgi:lysophospholipase L1-like esterase